MEAITSNILHLGVIPSEEDFQRAERRGEVGRGVGGGVQPGGNSNLLKDLQISGIKFVGICSHILFSPLWTISHEMISHMHKHSNIIWFAGFCLPDAAAETVREPHPATQCCVSQLDFASNQEPPKSPRERSEMGSALNDILSWGEVLTPDEPRWSIVLPRMLAGLPPCLPPAGWTFFIE